MSRPRGRFALSKARQGDSLRHQIPAPCPHSPPPLPPTGFTLTGALVDLMWYLAVTTTYHYIFMRARPESIKLY